MARPQRWTASNLELSLEFAHLADPCLKRPLLVYAQRALGLALEALGLPLNVLGLPLGPALNVVGLPLSLALNVLDLLLVPGARRAMVLARLSWFIPLSAASTTAPTAIRS